MDSDMATRGMRRRIYEAATPADVRRYESFSCLGGEPMQLDGALQFQVLYLSDTGENGVADFLDVAPIGSSPTDTGAIALVQQHHDAGSDSRDLWFLRGAGRNGEEIHAGYGHGMHASTRYRIVMIRTRNER